MFGLDGSYGMYVAFLKGYELGSGDDLLAKLQEKLVGDLGTGQNLGWEALLLRKLAPDDPASWLPLDIRDDSFDRLICQALFDHLEAPEGEA
ncbi:hypothetical protein Misp05_58330 [Micromonospora sp. NBRC 107095]|nr:hypothetical protein Misp05_58330 [Micromonospora sp. NBRC 107095]